MIKKFKKNYIKFVRVVSELPDDENVKVANVFFPTLIYSLIFAVMLIVVTLLYSLFKSLTGFDPIDLPGVTIIAVLFQFFITVYVKETFDYIENILNKELE